MGFIATQRQLTEMGRWPAVPCSLPRCVPAARKTFTSRLCGREFDYAAVAPAVLGIKKRLRGGRELRLAVIVHNARDGVEFSVADPDLDLRLRLDVAHPVGALALGNEVKAPTMLGEPDLDFPSLTGDATSGGQIEVHGADWTSHRDEPCSVVFACRYPWVLTFENKKRTIWRGRSRSPSLLPVCRRQDHLPSLHAERVDRLARLAAKHGPEITLRELTDRFSYDCLWRAEARLKKGKSACGLYLPDLEQPRPPDLPPGLVRLRVVASND
jgi:hypothetical protein